MQQIQSKIISIFIKIFLSLILHVGNIPQFLISKFHYLEIKIIIQPFTEHLFRKKLIKLIFHLE